MAATGFLCVHLHTFIGVLYSFLRCPGWGSFGFRLFSQHS
jgi:hypothetical protein